MPDWADIVNFGTPMVILLLGIVVGVPFLWALGKFFAKRFDKWLELAAGKWLNHDASQRDAARKAERSHKIEDDALRVLIETTVPPEGSAYVAAQSIYATAADMQRFKTVALKFCAICEHLATKSAESDAEIKIHSEAIRRIVMRDSDVKDD